MNNELINAAKDQAAQEAGYNTFNELISVDGYLSDNITLINRAMEMPPQNPFFAMHSLPDTNGGIRPLCMDMTYRENGKPMMRYVLFGIKLGWNYYQIHLN